jgi:hypothetical protein
MSTRSAALVLLATAAAVVLTGCGLRAHRAQRSGTVPARVADAIARADAVCADLAQRRVAVRRLAAHPPRPEVSARAYGALADLMVDAAQALDRVPLPSGDARGAVALRRYVAAAREESATAWRVRHALAAGDLAQARVLVGSFTGPQAPARALAREAGLRVCGDRA